MVHKILGYLDPPKHSVAVWRHGSAYRWRKVIFIFSLGSAINVPYCWEKCYCIYNIVNDNNKELYLHRTFHSGTAGQTALQQQSCLLGYQLISSACIGLENIRTETEFQAILVHCDSVPTMSSKKRRKQNSGLADYVVEEISTQADHNDETELRRIYYSCIDSVCGEMRNRFGKHNCDLFEALNALDPGQATFLDVTKVKPLLDLTKTSFKFSQCDFCIQKFQKATTLRLKWSYSLYYSHGMVILAL